VASQLAPVADQIGPVALPYRSPANQPPTRSRRAALGRMVLLIVVVVAATSLVRSYVVAPFSIPSGSMEQTLQVGDRILVDRISYRFTDVERGDIVVFDGTDTFGRLGDGTGETDYVKRVIGLPGDHVVCCDDRGRITVNDRPLHERAYLHPGDEPSDLRFDVEVPPGRLWLMGDHRSDSLDSRAHLGAPGGGTVPVDRVVGRVLFVVWPLDRVGGVPHVTVGSAARRSPPPGTEGRTR
jgi:signal peptidase I